MAYDTLALMNRFRWSALCAVIVAPVALGLPAVASGTPGAGVEAEILAQATRDGHDYITKEITIAPGGGTGWHFHQGRVYGLIRSGTLTHFRADCSVDGVYPPGAPITEESGPVHNGRNLGPDPLVMWVVYIDQAGAPPASDAADPGCGF